MIYRIKNWREFQHYKDRNPPWIKLHFSLLSSSDWVVLDDASRVLALACMLVGSRNEGQIDGSESGLAYLRRVAYLHKPPNIKPLIECGFLECASECKQMLANARPETEERQRREETPLSAVADGAFAQFWKTYPRKTSRQKAADAFKRLKPDDGLLSAMLSALVRQTASEQWRRGVIPHASTWLNQRRWEDQMPVAGAVQTPDETCRYRDPRGNVCGMPNAKPDPHHGGERRCQHHTYVVQQTGPMSQALRDALKSAVKAPAP